MGIEGCELSGMFSEIAPYYDRLNHFLSFNSDGLWRRRLVDMVKLPENALILDLCTGTADIAIEFAKRRNTFQVLGVDFSQVMLRKAHEKINKLGLEKQIRLVNADVFNLPFEPHSFDLVSMSFGLRNLVDPVKGIEIIAKMLKAGGQVVILEFSPPRKNLAGKVHSFYLKKIIPLISRIFGGSPVAYDYLSLSISTFLYPEQIFDCMELAGLKNPGRRKMCFGAVNLYYGEK